MLNYHRFHVVSLAFDEDIGFCPVANGLKQRLLRDPGRISNQDVEDVNHQDSHGLAFREWRAYSPTGFDVIQ